MYAALCLAAGAALCRAQSDTGGSVDGQVIAPGGQAVAGAVIHIENTVTGDRSDVTSGARGDFRFAELTPGGYTLRVRAPGLSDWEADHLMVGLGTVTRLKAALAARSLHRTVLVDARANAAVEAESDAAGQEISGLATEIPNNSQHWSSQAGLFGAAAPGTNGGLSFLGLSPLMNSIAIDGTDHTLAFRGRERGTGIGAEGNGFAAAQSAVGTFQISANSYSAAYGRAEAGSINSISKSGSSHMHGQAIFYDRGAIGQTFNAFSRVMEAVPAGTTTSQPVLYLNGQPITYVEQPYHAPDRRQQWEVSAGGPIRRERASWFFAWEQHERHDPAVARANEPEVFFFPPSGPTLTTLEARLAKSTSPLLVACPAAGPEGEGSTALAECAWSTVLRQLSGMLGTVPRSSRQTNLFGRIDWRVNTRNQLALEYSSMHRNAPHGVLGGASETDGIGSFGNSSTSDEGAGARWEYFVTPHLVSSTRLQFSRDVLSQSRAASTPFEQQFANNAWGLPPQISVDRSAGFSFGTLSTGNKREYPAETRQQFMDAATWVMGHQAIRFGYDYNHVVDVIDGINGENGAYSYASLLDFVSDLLAPNSCNGSSTGTGSWPCYQRYRQTVGPPNWTFSTADYAVYAADEWKPGRRLTVTAGLRYEYERLPDTNPALVNSAIPQTARLPHNREDLGPRAAFSLDLSGRGNTVVRGGFGLYYGRIPNATVYSALTSTGSARSPRTYSWRPMDAGAPQFPYVFAGDETPYVDPAAPDQRSTAPEVVYFDPHFHHPQINQADLSLEQAMGSRTLLIVTGMAAEGHHLTQFVDANVDLENTATLFYNVEAPGNEGNAGPLARNAAQVPGFTNIVYSPQRFYFERLNPAWGAVTDITSETNSSYRGVMVRLVRRMSRTLTVNAGYTYAHAIDDNQNEATFADRNDVYDPADPQIEHGTSNYDVRQRMAGGMVVREPWRPRGASGFLLGNYSIGAAGEWRTGLPFSMRTTGSVPTPSCSYQAWLIAGGATGNGARCLETIQQPNAIITGTAVPIPSLGPTLNGSGGEDLIPPVGRNTFRYPAAANFDLRLTKRIRLSDRYSFELLGEAFNALNHQNVTAIETSGYRIANDPAHANMATLTWQSGMRPTTQSVVVNGATETQYAYDATAAFGGVTNANSGAISRERQIQVGAKLIF